MRNIFTLLLLLLCILNCTHQKEIIITQNLEIFYPEKRPFSHFRRSLELVEEPPVISIVAVGDIMMGEHVVYYLNKYGTHYPFDSTQCYLTDAHFTIGNLEAPFSTSDEKYNKKFTFKVDPRYASGLAQAGFDVVNLANNHIMDCGKEGFINTTVTLDSIGIRYCGAGLNYEQAKQPALLTINNITVAFVGYSMTFPREFWATQDSAGTCYPYENDMIQTIQRCEQLADFTVVSFHWGQELWEYPKDYQIYFAHLAIDSGADLILGHHPHVLQGIEIYKNRLIIYSLGNFAFGSYSYNAKKSIILKSYLTQNGLLYARLIPISVYNLETAFQPKILTDSRADSVFSHLNDISLALNQDRQIIDETGIVWGQWAYNNLPQKITE